MDELAEKLRQDLLRLEKNAEEWVEVTLLLCQHLAEARANFDNPRRDREFHEWLGANKIHLNHNDRAAILKIAGLLVSQPQLTRDILVKTKRRSYQLIWRHDFKLGKGFTTASKPPGSEPDKTEPKETDYKPSNGPETLDAAQLVFDAVKMKPEQFSEYIFDTGASIENRLAPKKAYKDEYARKVFKQCVGMGLVVTGPLEAENIQVLNGILQKHGFTMVPYRPDDFEATEQKEAELVD
jgi:hypothetical protein